MDYDSLSVDELRALQKGEYDNLSVATLKQLQADNPPEIKENKRGVLGNILDRLKYGTIKGLQGGTLETVGTLGGGVGGAALGAGAGGIGAVPGGVAGSALGAAAGKNIEDLALYYMGAGPQRTFTDQGLRTLEAAKNGAMAEMAGQGTGKILAKAGDALLSPVGRILEEKVAPRLMTATVKDPELATQMLKRNEWGTAGSLIKKGEEGVKVLSQQVDDLLSQSKSPIDRMKIVDELESLRKEYARLPGRESETAAIEELQSKVFKSPTEKQIESGMTDYANLSPLQANALKKDVYAENTKLYKGNNYDPASIRAQTDMATARGLKEAIEDVAPEVKDLNKEVGHNIKLREVMEDIKKKGDKANLVQLMPMLAGLGIAPHGLLPAVAAPFAMGLAKTTVGGTGAAVATKKLGENLMTRSGTPKIGFLARMLSQRLLRDQN